MNRKTRFCVKSFFENAPPSFIELCALLRSRVMFSSSTSLFDDSASPVASSSSETVRVGDSNVFLPSQVQKEIIELRVYLGETLAREKLSPAVEEQRLRLLAKLIQFAPPPNSNNYCSGPAYIDMTRAATLPSLTNIGKVEGTTYQAMSEPGTSSTTAVAKSGRLGRRERFLWMGQIRKWWAVLSSSAVLTLYSGPNETRALSSIPLENYQARPVAQGKPSTVFELFSPGNKTFQFIASDQEDMDSWISAFNDVCSKRRLPRPPSPPPMPPSSQCQELYDTPDSRVRPVTPNKQEYEPMDGSFYHVISDSKFKPQEQLYKNVGDDDNCYYNLLPRCTEEIYQTIMEAEKVAPGTGQNRIQAIIKAMEATIAEAQLYEPVESGHELER